MANFFGAWLRHKCCQRCLCCLWVMTLVVVIAVVVVVFPGPLEELSYVDATCVTRESKASSLPEGVAHTHHYMQLMGHYHTDDDDHDGDGKVDDSVCHEAEGCERCHCGKGCLVYYPCVKIWVDVYVRDKKVASSISFKPEERYINSINSSSSSVANNNDEDDERNSNDFHDNNDDEDIDNHIGDEDKSLEGFPPHSATPTSGSVVPPSTSSLSYSPSSPSSSALHHFPSSHSASRSLRREGAVLVAQKRLLHTSREEKRANPQCSIRVCTADKETNDARLNEFWSRFKNPSTEFGCFVDSRPLNRHLPPAVVVSLNPATRLVPFLLLAPLLLFLVLFLVTVASAVAKRRDAKSHDRMFLVHVDETESNLEIGSGGGRGGIGGGGGGIANTYST